MLAKKNKPNPT